MLGAKKSDKPLPDPMLIKMARDIWHRYAIMEPNSLRKNTVVDTDITWRAITLGATARSYRRQDGADAAARFEKFLPARASLRPPIFLKFATE